MSKKPQVTLPIKFGMIGAGNSAHNLSTTLTNVPNAKLVALSDLKLDVGAKIIEQHHLPKEKLFTDYHEMLKLKELNAVIVSLPHSLHYPVCMDCFNAGKHVLCEKPLAINKKHGQVMIDFAKKKGLTLGTIFQNRFFTASQKAKEMITSGQLGQILHGQVNVLWQRDQDYYDKSPWRGKWASEGGGSLINQASHSIDLMVWLMGKPKKVFGLFGAKTHKIEVDDNAAAVIEFENGAYVTIQTSTSVKPGYPAKVNIFGTEGMVSVDGNSLRVVDKDGKDTITDFELKVGSADDPKKFSLEAQSRLINDFIDAIQNNRAPLVDGAEGLRAIEVIMAIYESKGENIIKLENNPII